MEPDIAAFASLIGDSTRAKMLTVLMCGKALTATELAVEADISPQTASSHLAKLVDGQVLAVRKQGRYKYFQLKNITVASLIETLLGIAADAQFTAIKTGPADPWLRKSRVCYDHLAGSVGVSLFDSLLNNDFIVERDNEVILSQKGKLHFQSLGIDFAHLAKSKRPVCKSCLDWSERRSHLSGALGHWVLTDLLQKGWAVQNLNSRVIRFTQAGIVKFNKAYKIIT